MAKRRGKHTGSVRPYKDGFRAAYAVTKGDRTERGSKVFRGKAAKATAEAWLRDQLNRGPSSGGSLGDWLDQWLAYLRTHSEAGTVARYESTVKTHIRPQLGDARLRDLDAPRLKRWLAALHAAGVSASERARAAKTLRAALNAAVSDGLLPASPIRGVKIPKHTPQEQRALTADEMRAVRDAADRAGHGAIFRLWFDAGVRVEELLAFRREDFDGRTVKVRQALCLTTHQPKAPKTERSKRTIILSPSTAAAIRNHLVATPDAPDSAPLFPTQRGRYWRYTNFRERVFLPIVKAAGLAGTGVVPKSPRHTCASQLLSAGVNVLIVSRRLGHANPAITLKVYGHMMPDDAEKAADVMERLLGGG